MGLSGAVMAQVQSSLVSASGWDAVRWGAARREAETIHVVGGASPRYRRSTDGGRTWHAPNLGPWVASGTGTSALASSGRHVYLIGWANQSTAFLSSSDDGETWQAVPNTTGLYPVESVAEGNTCHMLLGDEFANPARRLLAYVRTGDGGTTWSAPITFASTGSGFRRFFVDGGVLHVFFEVSGQLLYQRSGDAGVTWLATPVAFPFGQGEVAVAGSDLHVGGGYGPYVYHRSLDAGSTWSPAVTIPAPPGSLVGIAADAGHVHAAISANNGQVVVASSQDRGTTWSAQALGTLGGCAIAVSGDAVCLACSTYQWTSGGTLGTRSIAVSADAGASWTISPGSAIGSNAGRPGNAAIALRPPMVAVHWTRQDYWLPHYVWWPVDLDVSGDLGQSWHVRQQLGTSIFGGWAHFLGGEEDLGIFWADGFNGTTEPTDLHYGRIYGRERFGPSKAGTGGIAPRLVLRGAPQLGKPVAISLTDAVGGSMALQGVSFAGEANTMLGSSRLLLESPSMAFWGVTSGATGAPGAGVFALPFTIPNHPLLHQQRVVFQGFVFDANAAEGFASTAGLTMIVL